MIDDVARSFGFELEGRVEAGESPDGAWFARDADGGRVVLKWLPGESVAQRYAALLPALDVLRSRGVPVPEYPLVEVVDGWTISAQRVLPGRSHRIAPPRLLEQVLECVDAAAGVDGPRPEPWGTFLVRTLTVGEHGWCEHEPLRTCNPRAAAVLERIEAVGADADPGWFPTTGLVHLDLHTDNVLGAEDGSLTAIVDWEGACSGDHQFNLVNFVFDLYGHYQDVWTRIESSFEPRVLQAYVAHMALRCTDWAIRHHPEDVPRQLDRAERLLDRFEV